MTCDSRMHAIQELAYSKWEYAGCPQGDGVNFWLDAEQEILQNEPSENHVQSVCPTESCDRLIHPADPVSSTMSETIGTTRKKAG